MAMASQIDRTIPAFYRRTQHCGPAPEAPSMWSRSGVIGIAKASCTFCHGFGMRPVLVGQPVPCKCVFRAIFRACYARYRECEAMVRHTQGVTIERATGPSGYRLYSRKRQEFTADFCLVARRILVPADYELFRLHFLGDADWRVCCRKLNIDRGTFFHRTYLITEFLGRTFAELRPYPLYPVKEYFGGVVQSTSLSLLPPELDAEEAPPPGVFQWGGQRMVARR
jgi:hypothetical protein